MLHIHEFSVWTADKQMCFAGVWLKLESALKSEPDFLKANINNNIVDNEQKTVPRLDIAFCHYQHYQIEVTISLCGVRIVSNSRILRDKCKFHTCCDFSSSLSAYFW